MSSSFDGKRTVSDDVSKPFSPTAVGSSSAQQNGTSRTPGRADGRIVTVQPPRREDLQPSYAQILQGDDDTNTNGWYGSMSMFSLSSDDSRFFCSTSMETAHTFYG